MESEPLLDEASSMEASPGEPSSMGHNSLEPNPMEPSMFDFNPLEPDGAEEAVTTRLPTAATTMLSNVTPKDLVVVGFILILWIYSVVLIFRAWNRILNFSEDQLQRSSTEKSAFLWRWVMEHILQLSHRRNNSSNANDVVATADVIREDDDAERKAAAEERETSV